MLMAGVHPTIAGVLLGLLTPVHAWYDREDFLTVAGGALQDYQRHTEQEADSRALTGPLQQLGKARREGVAPVVRIEAALHPWVAYGIMPVFALANAGVSLGGVRLDEGGAAGLLAGVMLGLVVGKPLGIVAASFLAVKLGLAALPRGVTWRGVLVVGCVGGIGFTMAIFIAGLAFGAAASLGVAKLAVLLGSFGAMVVAMGVGRLLLPSSLAPEIAATTPDQAESSTEY
jgi:NhaA family Na+:H+ antiporter